MSVNYAEKFGFSEELVRSWQDKEIFLEGGNNTLIILVHGWSLTPRQMLSIGRKLNQKGYSVVLPKLAGHGSRPEDLASVRWSDWVDDAVNEIKKYKQNGEYKSIFIGGTSMGGNVSLLASLKVEVDGIILIGTPVHFKNHVIIKLLSLVGPMFRKYVKKRRPKNIDFDPSASYQYVPSKNIHQVLLLVRKSVFLLKKITAPILILQTREDFFVTKYSPWIIYKNVSSKIKKMQWIATQKESHVPRGGKELGEVVDAIEKFLRKIEKK